MEFDWVRLTLFDSVDFDRVRLVGFGSVSLAQRCSEFDGGMDLFQLSLSSLRREKAKSARRKSAKNLSAASPKQTKQKDWSVLTCCWR